MTEKRESSSYRDPSGFLFYRENILYRQINRSYKTDYDMLMGSGLYKALVDEGLLVEHEEVGIQPLEPEEAYRVIKPRKIPFLSYPYEWCFSQLKDAALATMRVQKKSFEYGMCLKDASAYNIQFDGGKPILIDTLSFEKYREGEPWIPYRQFCQHFLAPLALIGYKDMRFTQLFKSFMDGIPLDLASKLLPSGTRFSLSLLIHIHLHAKSQKKYGGKTVTARKSAVSKLAFSGIIESLSSSVQKLRWKAAETEWGAYYDNTNYTEEAFGEKMRIVDGFIGRKNPRTVWDLGANRGDFSRLASARKIQTVAFDIDPVAVELDYRMCREKMDGHLLPLLSDLTNPSPGIGWECSERKSLLERGPVDMAMALALIHHLVISNNVPPAMVAGFLRGICGALIIEFVPKEDSQVKRLLATRADIFPRYTVGCFEEDFSRFFRIEEKAPIAQSKRILYLMSSK
jgi:hypothetical protein